MRGEPESRFHEAMIEVYNRAKEEVGYNATYFLGMVLERGGLGAAKWLLVGDAPQYGFTKLWEASRLDITMEAQVLRREFRALFTQEEIERARARLREYGYDPGPTGGK